MSYFRNFPSVTYKFGTQDELTLYQDLSLYVDVIDQIKDQATLYRKYTIQNGFLPDQVSNELYGTPEFYWTFELVNDKLRESGWPLSENDITEFAKKQHPNKVLVTRADLTGKALSGTSALGLASGATGTVISRRLDFGQIIIDTQDTFQAETVQFTTTGGSTQNIVVDSFIDEFNSIHHYEDADLNYVDVDPAVGSSSIYTPITYVERYQRRNQELQEINVIKPSAIREINTLFQRTVRS